ncbi:alpha/beta hydrolase [Agrilactobacillus fermenti]|uniref:alpha/beta hydrolase n=1 Tax=Agrilactobacillus fermenti TaxID=2586909 RepID=UPI001E63EFA7|nr:alpha/beta hydrolase [Agrilactobacillus fermenti]MCD2257364.1 alpha/beta hydrolase [Agrilactobacillus fermenti]
MRKRFWGWIGIILTIVMVIIAVVFGVHRYHMKQQVETVKRVYQKTATPTIFVHGYHGRFASEADMMADIHEAGIGTHVMTITVDLKGKLHVKGVLSKGTLNPLIGIVFENNTAGEMQFSLWLQKALVLLKQKYHVTNYNAIGHSMGAVAWVLYSLRKKDLNAVPRMQKLVTIAGPFDGILGFGDQANRNYFLNSQLEPKFQTPLFRQMKATADQFPKQVPVLNIYGNLQDGSNSDSVVSLVSARSLSYLIQPYAKSYQELQVTGSNAQHSHLHMHNPTVTQAIEKFIWAKPVADKTNKITH